MGRKKREKMCSGVCLKDEQFEFIISIGMLNVNLIEEIVEAMKERREFCTSSICLIIIIYSFIRRGGVLFRN